MSFEIRVRADELSAELQTARAVVARKPPVPILSHALLETNGHLLGVTASDLEVTFRGRCPAVAGSGRGATTVDADTFADLMRTLGDQLVDLAVHDDGKLRVASGSFRSVFPTFDPRDFPTIPAPPSTPPITLPRVGLREALEATRFAVSAGDKRYYMNGLLLDLNNAGSVIVGTDGYRVAVHALPVSVPDHVAVVVPIRSVPSLLAMLDGDGDDVVLTQGEHHLFFTVGDHGLITRIIDGAFPPYQKIVPARAPAVATFERESLSTALRRLQPIADDRRAVHMRLSPSGVLLSVQNVRGDAQQEVAADYHGDPIDISCNVGHVLNFLDATAAPSVTFSAATPTAVQLWEAGETYRYAMAPMRL